MKAKSLILTLLAGATCAVLAAEPVPPLASPKRGLPLPEDPVALAVLADQLAALGEAGNDPLAYLMAARIQKGLRVKNADAGTKGSDDSRYTLFLERAKALAGEGPDYLAIAGRIESAGSRGVVSGISQHRSVLAAGAGQSFKLTFKGEEDAGVALMLDAGHPGYARRAEIDLDLYVRDEEGRTICALEGPGVPELCAWTPKATGKFTAQVVNRGQIDAPFVLNFR